MLYLEDYLELIEHLPQELRDRFTDIRERDLQVHNSTEQLKEKVKLFFAEAKKLKPEQRQCDYEKLINDYQETIKYADDKVRIATQMHDIMMTKLVQRLDTELEKLKLELEADHAGITEQLERRSLELDADSCLSDNGHVINNYHLNTTTNNSSINNNGNGYLITKSIQATTSKSIPSGIKDRRRSEHKHRHHPYQNNQDNGYHGRAKLSHYEHSSSKNPIHQPHNNSHHHLNNHQHHGSKTIHNASVSNSCRQQATSSPNPHLNSSGYSSFSAPASVAGDFNGTESGHYGNNLSSFGNNSGFKTSNNNKNNNNNIQNITANNIPFNQQHSALSAALSSTTPQLNSVSALALMNATSVHNKISNNLKQATEMIGPNFPLVRQNPIAAAASQAIAATQQLQQGRRTPSLKASFAAINSGGLGHFEALGNNNRSITTSTIPDQTVLKHSNQSCRISSNGNSSPLFISVTKSGRTTKRPRHHTSHLFPDESPTSISSDNSVFENSESLSSTDFIETGTTFGSTSPSSLDFATNTQGNTTLYHRDETKYCICRQISYGEMVACDNTECEIEWFHYECVNITQPPKGKWYCPDCTRQMIGHHQHLNQPQTQKKRGRKEKSLFNLVNDSLDTVRSKDRGSEQAKSIV